MSYYRERMVKSYLKKALVTVKRIIKQWVNGEIEFTQEPDDLMEIPTYNSFCIEYHSNKNQREN